MYTEANLISLDAIYPILILPKTCTPLESSEAGDDSFHMKIDITTQDTEGTIISIYSGLVNVKLIEEYLPVEFGTDLDSLPQDAEFVVHESVKPKERKYSEIEPVEVALQQLLAPNARNKSRKTIIFSGHDAKYGLTVQQIAKNNPLEECTDSQSADKSDLYTNSTTAADSKKYQCETCEQIFNVYSDYKEHRVSIHSRPRRNTGNSTIGGSHYICCQCGKSLKTPEKLDHHYDGHGNPERECEVCYKVLSTKLSLKNHKRLHKRKFACTQCTKSFPDAEDMKSHVEKAHKVETKPEPVKIHVKSIDPDLPDYILQSYIDEADNILSSIGENCIDFGDVMDNNVKEDDVPMNIDPDEDSDDYVIAKILSNPAFLGKEKKYCNKRCNVCSKRFDRIGDLQRHLIQHLIRSTLSKNPVGKDGTLKLRCPVCNTEPFSAIDKYKAHLRDHAKLTIYKCTFCDKSFSDSSNFSKHKKVHAVSYLQCDLCQRKYKSKKSLAKHLVYHDTNSPQKCRYCGKMFYFDSDLKKHLKFSHSRKPSLKYRCKVCELHFMALKEKWDHEWTVHKMRKYVIDCNICGAMFRKYSELKRHCNEFHDLRIPNMRRFFKESKMFR